MPIYTPVPGQRPTLTASAGPSVWGWKSWGTGRSRQGQGENAQLLVNIAGHILLCSFGNLSCPPPMSRISVRALLRHSTARAIDAKVSSMAFAFRLCSMYTSVAKRSSTKIDCDYVAAIHLRSAGCFHMRRPQSWLGKNHNSARFSASSLRACLTESGLYEVRRHVSFDCWR